MITIFVVGPQGSGKSTIVRAIRPVIEALGIKVNIVESNQPLSEAPIDQRYEIHTGASHLI